MKRIISLIGLLLIIHYASAQPQWQWCLNEFGVWDDEGTAITTDKAGYIYVAGIFTKSLTLDTITLVSYGNKDVFIAKYAPNGQIIWARSGGSVAEENARAIITDSSGNVYMTGSYGGHINNSYAFTDTALFSGSSIVSKGGEDIYLVKYDSNGNLIWVKSYGSEYDDIGTSLARNQADKILFTGVFSRYNGSPPMSGTITFDAISMTSAGDDDIFMVSLTTNGIIEWSKRYGSSQNEYSTKIKTDAFDNIYLIGGFTDNITFNSTTISSISSGFIIGNIFVAKFDPNGNVIWVRPIGGVNSGGINGGATTGISIYPTSTGLVYIAGAHFNSALKFHTGFMLPYQDQFQIYLALFDNNGNLSWAQQMGGLSGDACSDIWVDQNENAYLTGYFRHSGIFGMDTITGFGYQDAFITKYDKAGNEKWVLNMGGSSNDMGNGIVGRNDGSIYVTGAFNSSGFNYGGSMLTNSGSWDVFLVKLSDPTGVEELNPTAHEVQVYPNPVSDVLNIHSNKKLFNEVSVYDPLGRLVFHEKTEKQKDKTSIHLGHLPEGMYYLQLSGAGSPQTKKIIIQH